MFKVWGNENLKPDSKSENLKPNSKSENLKPDSQSEKPKTCFPWLDFEIKIVFLFFFALIFQPWNLTPKVPNWKPNLRFRVWGLSRFSMEGPGLLQGSIQGSPRAPQAPPRAPPGPLGFCNLKLFLGLSLPIPAGYSLPGGLWLGVQGGCFGWFFGCTLVLQN